VDPASFKQHLISRFSFSFSNRRISDISILRGSLSSAFRQIYLRALFRIHGAMLSSLKRLASPHLKLDLSSFSNRSKPLSPFKLPLVLVRPCYLQNFWAPTPREKLGRQVYGQNFGWRPPPSTSLPNTTVFISHFVVRSPPRPPIYPPLPLYSAYFPPGGLGVPPAPIFSCPRTSLSTICSPERHIFPPLSICFSLTGICRSAFVVTA